MPKTANCSLEPMQLPHKPAKPFLFMRTPLLLLLAKPCITKFTRSRTDYSPSAVSRIAYIALVDNSHKSMFTQKVSLEQGVGQGDFLSPPRSKPVIINCWLTPDGRRTNPILRMR
jgi:hypothetical protein